MNREKALETVIVLALVSLLAFLKFHLVWFIYLAIGLLIISLLSKKLTFAIGKGWFSFSYYLGVIMNTFIMFLIFYLVLVPLSFFQRLVGNNQILKKNKNNSYFHKRNHCFVSKDIDRPW
ncbi:MAG: SxtJ family membrane protein [Flavobacteriales bacterium]